MNWIYYLLEANLYLTVFYALYYLTLKNETYYQLNRAYLLITSALAFLIPFLQLGFLKPVYRISAPVITQFQRPVLITLSPPVHNSGWDTADYVLSVYICVSCVFVIHLGIKIFSLIRLSYKNGIVASNSYQLIEIAEGENAFSFFNYLFISGGQFQKQTVINHELIHIQQKHSWDILYLQLLKIVNWFNPVVYLLQYSIKEQHEFIADRETSRREENASAYANFLLSSAYGLDGSSLANTFFNKSLLKKRIIMLHQKPSGNLARLKYLAALPICAVLLCASTLAFSKTYGWIDLVPKLKNDTTYSKKTEHNNEYLSVNDFTNKKGYRIVERINAHNEVWSEKVTITDKAGKQHVYDDKTITPAERKTLLEVYGYEFPKMKVTGVTLTSPPVNTPPVPPPPTPPGKPNKKSNKKTGVVTPTPSAKINVPVPPPPPAEITMNYPDSSKANLKVKNVKTVNQFLVVNGTQYRFKAKVRPNERVYISGQNSVVYYTPGDLYAKGKWGAEADSGVIVLSGKPMITIK